MRAVLLWVVFFTAGWLTSASAQQPLASVVSHYRAYRDALETGDLDAAEAAAERALAASQAETDAARTAVLALNLATLRLTRGEHASALEPARLALSFAAEHPEASTFNPLMAQLAHGRAWLRVDGEAANPYLWSVLQQAQAVGGLAAEAYPAAVELGVWTIERRRYALASEVWSTAARLAEGSSTDPAYARGQALTWQAASTIVLSRSRDMHARAAMPVLTALNEAVSLLRPLAAAAPPDSPVTLAQSAYAQALAWRSLLRAKLGDEFDRVQSEEGEPGNGLLYPDPPNSDGRPLCLTRINPDPLPSYPGDAVEDSNVGAVVLRVQISDDGALTRREIAAVVGGEQFGDAVRAVYERWRVELREGSEPNCQMAMSGLISVTFLMSD